LQRHADFQADISDFLFRQGESVPGRRRQLLGWYKYLPGEIGTEGDMQQWSEKFIGDQADTSSCAHPIIPLSDPVGVEVRYISEFCSIGVRSAHTKGIKPFKGIVEIVVFFHSCDQFGILENYPRIPAPDDATGNGANVIIEPEAPTFGIDPRVEIKRRSFPVRFEVSHQMERHQWIGLLVSVPLLERDGRTGFYSKIRGL